MATPNLNWPEVSASQNQKEVTINGTFNNIEDSFTEVLSVDLTSGDVVLTNDQFRQNFIFITANLTVARNLTVPQIKRFFGVSNATGTDILSVIRGSTTINVPAGQARILYADGTTNGLENIGGGGGAEALNDLTDVVITSPVTDQGIVYDGTNWVNQAIASGSGVVASLGFQGAQASRLNTTQSISSGVDTPVEFDTEELDTGGFVDLGSQNTRITIPAGVRRVLVLPTIAFTGGGATGGRQAKVRKNGTDTLSNVQYGTSSATNIISAHPTLVDVVEGDYLELVGFQSSGGSISISNGIGTRLTVIVVDPPPAQLVGTASAFRGVTVRRTAEQNIVTPDVFETITWDQELVDTDNFHDTAVNNTRLTVPAGVTRVRLRCNIAVNDHGSNLRWVVQSIKNGAVHEGQIYVRPLSDGSGFGEIAAASAVLSVVEGDYFELQVLVDTANADVAANERTWFEMEVVDTGVVPANAEGVLATKTAVQAITTATLTALSFDTESFDDLAFHDNVTNNSRITVPSGVNRIDLKARVAFAASATGIRRAVITKNGAEVVGGSELRVGAASAGETVLSLASGMLVVAPGDYFEVEVEQTSGGNLNVEADSWFSAQKVVSAVGPAFRGALVYNQVSQSIPTANWTALTLANVEYDTDGFWDVANPTRFTVPAGVSRVKMYGGTRLDIDPSANFVGVRASKNGVQLLPQIQAGWSSDVPSGRTFTPAIATPAISVAPGDYLEIEAFHVAGSSQNTNSTAGTTWGAIEIIE